MKVLIIGSKGFIGSACYRHFKGIDGFEAFGADVVVDYTDDHYFLIDATNADYKEIFKSHKFDWCINCAGAASVPDSFIHPLRDYTLNVHHVVQLLNAIRNDNSNCKFLQLSSAAVYGNPQTLPVKENDELKPLSPYGIHKKQAEELCKMHHQYFGIGICIVRIFSAYGIGLKKQIFWDLYKKSQAGSSILLHGTGNETREFIYVDDIAIAIKTIITNYKSDLQVINVANNHSVNIKNTAELFLEHIGFTGELNFNNINRDGDPLYWQADNSLLGGFGYKPTISFEQGIQKYCNWLKENE